MQKDINLIEKEANQKIMEDMKNLINKHVINHRNTNAFMTINKCLDELVNVEQYSRLKTI